MRPVASAAEVREMDRLVIEHHGVPGVALIEVAARGVALAIRRHHHGAASEGVVVVCGAGNNGGDGYACARWLHGWGYPVRVWPLGKPPQGDAAVMRAAWQRLGLPDAHSAEGAGLVVDAVFGTGLSRQVGGHYATVLTTIAAQAVPVVAVDLPSGLACDTGAVLGVALPAVRTVTFGCTKRAMVGEPGADLCGVVEVVDIGLGLSGVQTQAMIPDAADLAELWPQRSAAGHKGRSGHLLVVAGSRAMAGAAVLCCQGALAAGAGLVTLCTPNGALSRLAALPPEVMVISGGHGDRCCALPHSLDAFDAIIAGPGLGAGVGLEPSLRTALGRLWRQHPGPVLFDADALVEAVDGGGLARVITPHPGEAARMLGCSAAEVQADRFAAVAALAAGCTALLKGRHTLVSAGSSISINPTGNPVLSTGGSGDVLAGVVGALLARACSPYDAARLGAWVHGAAADKLAASCNEGWTASDIVANIPAAVPIG